MRVNRRAPDPEWVEMYRRGITSEKIAELSGVGRSTVRYHLRLAVLADPDLRAIHHAALVPGTRMSRAGLANMVDVVALYERERRLPSTKSQDPRERTLAVWLSRRRQEVDRGTLDPLYAAGMKSIPGWEERTRKAKDQSRWNNRLAGVVAHVSAGNDWPRHKNPESEQERILGIWLQYQRTKLADGRLDAEKESWLNHALPGWLNGRARGRKKAVS